MAAYQNGNKPADSTIQNKLMTGQGDSRGPVGMLSRGSNVYNGGSNSSTGGPMQNQQQPPMQPSPTQFIMNQPQNQSTAILTKIAQMRLAQIFGGMMQNGTR